MSLSFGIAVFPHHSKTVAGVLKAADRALYQAKSQGRNRVVIPV
jgi:diguanylate cyclase (GGDEF)-like protein